MNYKVNPDYLKIEAKLFHVLELFEREGQIIQKGRNLIKVIETEGLRLNVKSFKIPNIVNKYAYRFLRKSKAKRSFLYAVKLLEMGIKTPAPVAYIEFYKYGGLARSYYISIHEDYDYTFRDLINRNVNEINDVLIEFTRFTHNFHKKGVYFIDHSPGNTLIKEKNSSSYDFYLVDLNRTKFVQVNLKLGIKNFNRLGANEAMIRIMAKEYARLRAADTDYVISEILRMSLKHNKAVRIKKAKKQKREAKRHFKK